MCVARPASLLLLALACAAPALAAPVWHRLGSTDDGSVYLLHADVRGTPQRPRAWVMARHARPLADGSRASKDFLEVDCLSWTWSLLETLRFARVDGQGNPAGEDAFLAVSRPIVPGSTAELVARRVCR